MNAVDLNAVSNQFSNSGIFSCMAGNRISDGRSGIVVGQEMSIEFNKPVVMWTLGKSLWIRCSPLQVSNDKYILFTPFAK